jgi:peroxiredoxin
MGESRSHMSITLLSDPGAKVIRRYGLLHEKRSHAKEHPESDIALRTTLLIDPEGRERWRRVSKSVPDIPTTDETVADIKTTQERGVSR